MKNIDTLYKYYSNESWKNVFGDWTIRLHLQNILMIHLNVCHTLKTYILKKNYIIW